MREIFVFGSNLAGRHGAGAAQHALRYCGAVYGCSMGLQGNSYAIPTKDAYFNTLPLDRIKEYVDIFLSYAKYAHEYRPELRFKVTAIGCGLAGLKPEQVAPMFRGAPANCILPPEFTKVLQ